MHTAADLSGQTLNQRYRLLSPLGSGGMGVVYRALDVELQREVAVKVLPQTALDAEARARLLHEARMAAALNHPHIVSVHDVGEDGGAPFVVMELVPGRSLREWPPLTYPQIVTLGVQLCEALDHAHRHGIVHRDLKPENILIVDDGGGETMGPAKLADLGIAYSSRTTRLTQDGAILGTAFYLAPEQALGIALDARADLYALGVVLYERVTGRLPFTGDDPLAVISQHLHAPVVPPRTFSDDVPAALEAVILRLLAKDPAQRFESARATAEALAAAFRAPAGAAPAAAESGSVALLEQLGRGRLVGRGAELQQLRELWRHARRGRGHLALISGEPGAGKTRLAHEAIVYAQLGGALVMRGGCYEYEAATPYLPLVEALRAWVRTQSPEALRAAVGPLASELVKLAPEIEAKLGGLAASAALSPQEERLRLFDSLARLLRSLASERGLLLFIDDLHWADHGTIALLHYLLRNLREDPLLVLATYREIELDRTHPLAAALVDWNRERLATRVPLGRLPLGDTAAMLATLLSQEEVSPDFADAVHRETEGNPFFIEEVIKSLIEQGQIYRGGGEWQRSEIRELTIPQSVKAAIGRRIDRLNQVCVETLQCAAALGKAFEFDELVAVAGRDEDALLDALDEATRAQLVESRGGESFAFTHDKIREVLYEELNPVRRRRLHLRVGEGLERIRASHLDARAQDLAHHYLQGGNLEKGMEYAIAAAGQASRVFAHGEALGFLERARECAEELGRTDRVAEIEASLAGVHQRSGEFVRTVEHYQRALALTTTPARRAALKTMIGSAYGQVGDARGLPFLNQALEELDPERQVLEVARTLLSIGRFHHYAGRPFEAIEQLERALERAEPLDDLDTLTITYAYLAGAYQHLARFEESMAWARRSIALGERKEAPGAVAMGHEFLAEDLYNLGRWRETLEHGSINRTIGERIGSLDRVCWADFSMAWARHGLGELAEAASVAGRSLALAERIGEQRLQVLSRSVLSMIQTDLGLDHDALANAERAVAEGDALAQVAMRSHSRRGLIYFLLQSGATAPALARSRELVEIRRGTEIRQAVESYAMLHASAALAEGEFEEAMERVEFSLEATRLSGSRPFAAIAERVRGQIHAARGEAQAARRDLDSAIATLESAESRIELARALEARARLNECTGRGDEAAGDLAQACELFERCGAVRDLARARGRSG